MVKVKEIGRSFVSRDPRTITLPWDDPNTDWNGLEEPSIGRIIKPEFNPVDSRSALETDLRHHYHEITQPSIYAMEESFSLNGGKKTRSGLVLLVDANDSDVKTHENTKPGGVNNRKRLLESLRANLEITLMSGDGVKELVGYALQGSSARYNLEAFGVEYTLHQVSDAEIIGHVKKHLEGKWVYILDGHHRNEAAGKSEFGYNMVYLSDNNDIEIFPWHRMVTGFSDGQFCQLSIKLDQRGFHITPLESSKVEHIIKEMGNSIVIAYADRHCLLSNGSTGSVESDLSNFHACVLDSLFDGIINKEQIRYKNGVNGLPNPAEGELLALLSYPPRDIIRRFADAGQNMPQKSTNIQPKVNSGIIIAPFDI